MSQTLGKSAMEQKMQEHWSSWITEGDFGEIAGAGLNFVRIPIGYWSVSPIGGDPYVQGAYEWLGKSLDWAQGAGLKVMIDLHGAPGKDHATIHDTFEMLTFSRLAERLRQLRTVGSDRLDARKHCRKDPESSEEDPKRPCLAPGRCCHRIVE